MKQIDIAGYLTFWFLLASVVCAGWMLGSSILQNLPAITDYVKANPAFAAMIFCWCGAGASFWYGITR